VAAQLAAQNGRVAEWLKAPDSKLKKPSFRCFLLSYAIANLPNVNNDFYHIQLCF
jgi:hypothetical protein